MRQGLSIAGLVLALVVGFGAPAAAQVEVGASLAGVTFVKESGGDTNTVFGVPSGSFGMLTPGAYVSFFATKSLAIEGTLGLAVVSGGGESFHLFNTAGQVAWFMKGEEESSPFIFGLAGVIHSTDSDFTGTYGVGGGYRFKCGENLAVRLQGRYTRIHDSGNVFDIGVTIGGVFGKK